MFGGKLCGHAQRFRASTDNTQHLLNPPPRSSGSRRLWPRRPSTALSPPAFFCTSVRLLTLALAIMRYSKLTECAAPFAVDYVYKLV